MRLPTHPLVSRTRIAFFLHPLVSVAYIAYPTPHSRDKMSACWALAPNLRVSLTSATVSTTQRITSTARLYSYNLFNHALLLAVDPCSFGLQRTTASESCLMKLLRMTPSRRCVNMKQGALHYSNASIYTFIPIVKKYKHERSGV